MKKRVISAIVLIAIFVPILLLGGMPFAIFMSIAAVVSMYELVNARTKKKGFPFLPLLCSYIFVLVLTLSNYNINTFDYHLDYRIIAGMIFAFVAPLVFINNTKKYGLNDALFLVGSTLFIGISFSLLIQIRNFQLDFVIYLFLVTILTDTFAYITGKNVGKHKLAPKVSPNKTIEGTIGGTLMGTFASVLYYNAVINPHLNIFILIIITIVLSLIGQLGDLAFSFIKREFEVKDFSNLIPGHGGVLDRLDSMIFVVLGFMLFLVIL